MKSYIFFVGKGKNKYVDTLYAKNMNDAKKKIRNDLGIKRISKNIIIKEWS